MTIKNERGRLRPPPLKIVAFVGVVVLFLFALTWSPETGWKDLLWILGIGIVLLAVLWAQQRRPFLQYVYYCRFSILIGLLLLALPVLGLCVAPTLLRNIFELDALDIVAVTWLALLASWAVMVSGGLTVDYAHLRFDVVRWPSPRWLTDVLESGFGIALFSLLALPTVLAAFWLSSDPWWVRIGAVVGGAVLALVMFVVAIALSEYLSPHDCHDWNLIPSRRWKLLHRLRKTKVPRFASTPRRHCERLLGARHASLKNGYLNSEGHFLPGHLFAMSLLMVTLFAYLIGYAVLRPPVPWIDVPPLGYVLLLLMLLGFVLPMIAFFLDRWKVPVSIALGAVLLGLYFSDTDHYYALLPPVAPVGQKQTSPGHGEVKIVGGEEERARAEMERRESGEIRGALRARVKHWREQHPQREPFIVVVAASGGGITASLWTTRVLAGLQEEFGDEFADALHLVSAVSGGSVGAMYYIAAFDSGRAPVDLEAVRKQSGRSSLSATAWGLTYPDLWRLLSLSLDRYRDRGWAMEQAWKATLGTDPTLADWRADVRAGRRPAVLFNATIAETGDRYVLSSLALSRRPDDCGETSTACDDSLDAHTLAHLYQGADLHVTTAARLSATFPFVSPIARAWMMNGQTCDGYHVADGGYYDNFGVLSVVEWLQHVMEIEGAPRRVLLVQIRAFGPRDRAAARSRSGWAYATVGPLLTLLNVRDAAQVTRNNLDVAMLREVGRNHEPPFEIVSAVFPLVMDAPLSWDLSDVERRDIERHWDWCRDVAPAPDGKGGERQSLIHQGLATVRGFFGREPAPPPPNAADPDVQRFCLNTAS